MDLSVSARTVRRRLDEAGLFGRIARKEYPFTTVHIQKRLSFATGYGNWTVKQWGTVLFSDETHIELGERKAQVWVQRPAAAAFDPEYMSHKVAHPQRVSAWGCFSASGVGDIAIFTENLDAKKMKAILQKHLLASALRLFPSGQWWLLWDNDPKHHSDTVKRWLHNHGVDPMDLPSHSPDLNPMENLWNDLKRRVETHNARDIEELTQYYMMSGMQPAQIFSLH